MARVTTAAVATVFLLVTATPGADDKGTKKALAGTWTRTVGEHTITFIFKGDTLHTVLKNGDQTAEIDADYGLSKEGVLFGRISKVSNEGGDGPSKGDLFSFRFEIDDNTLTVSDLKTHNDSAEARDLVQGEYRKQKGKAK
jgi:hypothetical protein